MDPPRTFTPGETLVLGLGGAAVDGAAAAPSPGTVLRGSFRVLRTLGSGAMGTVYDAVDVMLDGSASLVAVVDEEGRAQGVLHWNDLVGGLRTRERDA